MTKANIKARKNTPAPSPTTPERRALKPHQVLVSSTIQNAVGIKSWCSFAGEPDLAEMLDEIRDQVKQLQAGDMSGVEAMLYSQAMSLQTIFTSLSRKAASSEYLKQFQANLGLALKAQAQCRATLQALAEIKNPRPVLITKQANISGGHQQVVNGTTPGIPASSGACAEENSSSRNELLETAKVPMSFGPASVAEDAVVASQTHGVQER